MPIKEAWRLDRIPSGYARVWCQSPSLNLVGLLGPNSPRLTGGFGGWNTVDRARQVGMTVWKGVDPYKLEFQIILDGGTGGADINESNNEIYSRPDIRPESQEPVLRDLLAVARGDAEHSEPGTVHVEGIPSLPTDRWVIDNLEFGTDAVRRVSDMHRIRVIVDFTLLEYVTPTYLPISKRALGKDLGRTVVIKVKSGDTPGRIARRRGCKWTDLRTLNPGVVKKSSQNLKDGIRIRVPAAEKKGSNKKNTHK